MSREGTGLRIMGCAVGMLIAAIICEQIAPGFENPYLVLLVCLAIGGIAGYLLMAVFRKWILKKRASR